MVLARADGDLDGASRLARRVTTPADFKAPAARPAPEPGAPELSRSKRIAACLVNHGPLIPAIFGFGGCALGKSTRGWDGLALVVSFGGWAALGMLAMLVVNARLLRRRRQTLGLAYFDAEFEGSNAARLVRGLAVTALAPFVLFGVVLIVIAESYEPSGLLYLIPLGAWALDWLFWLGPARRTLGDRLAGAHAVPLSSPLRTPDEAARPEPRWVAAMLLAPPLLFLPFAAQFDGGAAGDFVGLLVSAFPVALKRLSR